MPEANSRVASRRCSASLRPADARLPRPRRRCARYPFVRLDEAKRGALGARRRAHRLRHGRPARGDGRRSSARRSRGDRADDGLSARRRAAGAARGDRRLGASGASACELDPEREIIPTLGSKEAIFHLAQVVVDRAASRDLVARDRARAIRCPSAARCFAGARVVPAAAARGRTGSCPTSTRSPTETWRRAALVWINYPNNPTGAIAPLAFYERLAELARAARFVLASDEAYSELYFGEPPVSALQLADRRNVVAFNTLSKRSSMTGYRCGLRRRRPGADRARCERTGPNVGTAPQEFVQRASVAAWGDEEHVERDARAVRAQARVLARGARARRACASPAATRRSSSGSRCPTASRRRRFAERLLEDGVVVAPGSYFGAGRRGLRPPRARADARGVRAGRGDPCETIRRVSATRFDERVAQITARDDYVKPAAWALGVATRSAAATRSTSGSRASTAGATAAPAATIWDAAGAPPLPRSHASTPTRSRARSPIFELLDGRRRRAPELAALRALGPSPAAPSSPATASRARRRLHRRPRCGARVRRGRLPAPPPALAPRWSRPHGLEPRRHLRRARRTSSGPSDGPFAVDGLRARAAAALARRRRARRPLGGQVPADDRLRRPDRRADRRRRPRPARRAPGRRARRSCTRAS